MKKKSTIIAALLLVVAVAAASFLYLKFRPTTTKGEKEIAVTVIHADSSERVFTYHTEEEYLGKVLLDEELIAGEEGPYGLFMLTVDGETVDDSKQQWWCITKGGEMVNTAIETTTIQDGDKFELTLKEGY